MNIYINPQAYVYKIVCIPTGQIYYGYRTANIKLGRLAKDDFWIHYFTSSKFVLELTNQYGKDSFYTSIEYEGSLEDAYWKEQEYIKLNWNNPLLINRHYHDKLKGHKIFQPVIGFSHANTPEAIEQRVKTRYQKGLYNNTWLAKTYELTTPLGDTIIVTNLAKFCREHNLTKQCMNDIIKGKQLQHKGWKCKKLI